MKFFDFKGATEQKWLIAIAIEYKSRFTNLSNFTELNPKNMKIKIFSHYSSSRFQCSTDDPELGKAVAALE